MSKKPVKSGNLLADLQKGSNLRLRRFKKKDRLYWLSEKGEMNITGYLSCKVEDLEEEVTQYILANATVIT